MHYNMELRCDNYNITLNRTMSGDVSRSCDCCEGLTSPNQPTELAVLKRSVQKDGRSFNTRWYNNFPWIHYCIGRNKVFCFYCLVAYEKELITFTIHPKTAFFIEGFNNWKKAIERFHMHEKAEIHKEAKMKILSSQAPSVMEQLSNEAAKRRGENRKNILKMISSLRYLLRQGLAIRGHQESEGNLIQLLFLRSEDDPSLRLFLKEQRYLSPEVMNEIIAY